MRNREMLMMMMREEEEENYEAQVCWSEIVKPNA